MAGAKYDAHYRVSSVDPPELVRFIKEVHPDVDFEFPRYGNGKVVTMWNLIAKDTMPPTQISRYCCRYLKEDGGKGRDKITGVRWAESNRRRKKRAGIEVEKQKDIHKLDPDNMDDDMVRFCMNSKGFILNPIIDWEDEDVWEFIHRYKIPYCHLYDEGWERLGCIGCPMKSDNGKEDYKKYPKVLKRLVKAAQTYLETHPNCSSQKNFSGDACNVIFHNIFCESYDEYDTKMSVDLWGGQLDTKEFLQQYFNIKF